MRYIKLAILALCISSASAVHSQQYPTHPITLVVSFAAGGFTDRLGRAVAEQLSTQLGQPVIVENRTGAGGAIGASMVAHAKPDGYTLLLGNNPLVITASLNSNVSYKPLTDFAPIAALGTTPNVLVVNSSFPAKSLSEFVNIVKKNPGKYSYGTSATGSTSHLGMEIFKAAAGIDLVRVPYKGSSQLITDFLAGRVVATVDNLLFQLSYIKDGRVRALALMTEQRSELTPELPTVGELGYPGTESGPWYMVLAPKGTPNEIVNRLNTEILKLLVKPAYLEKVKGMQVKGSSPDEARALLISEYAKWDQVVKKLGLNK